MLDKGCEKIVESPEAMVALGETVGRSLQSGDFLALRGGLGAGKTHFTKGVVAGLGCKEMVTSPTFTLAHEYMGGRLSVFHFDFYRMETEEQDTSSWKLVGTTHVDYALPSGSVTAKGRERLELVHEGVYYIGDHTTHPSVHGTLRSVERLLERLEIALPLQSS